MDKVPEQEDNLPRYQPRKPIAVGSVDHSESTAVFPSFELAEQTQKAEPQDSIKIEQRIAPGLKAFNVNDLIDKGLFDAAEYFLGRPLTSAERAHGMMSKTQYEDYLKQQLKESQAKSTNQLLAELLATMKAAGEKKDDEKKDDDDDLYTVPTMQRLGISLDDDDEDAIDDPVVRKRIVQKYGQAVYDEMQTTAREDWSPAEMGIFAEVMPGASPDAATEYAKTVVVPQKKADPAEIVPGFDADRIYSVDEARTLIGQWRKDYPQIKTDIGKNGELFGNLPKQKNKDTYTVWVRNSYKEIEAWKLEQARQVELPADEKEEGERLVAHGVKPDKLRLAPFGKWFISRQRLDDEDVVSILRRDRQKLNDFPNKTVSTAMKIVLTAWLDKKAMPTELLSPEEKDWLDWAFHQANIVIKKKPVSKLMVVKTPKQMKERLSVLFGEITEGPNDNPLLKTEFKRLFAQANLRGILNETQMDTGRELIKTF